MIMIKKITAIMLIILLSCSSVVFAATPSDYKAILQTLEALDYSSDFPFDSFLTRAQYTKMAVMISPYRDMVATNLSVSPFVDVTHKYWGSPYIHTAVTNGMINGYVDGTFKPENNINYEEAVTIALKILGYTNADFGPSWPSGQMGTARQIGLTDNISASVGEPIQRGDAITLLYNTLCSTPKGGMGNYIDSLGYRITDDVTIIATHKQDTSIATDKVSTSAGTYKINSYFDFNIVGMKGTIVTEDDEFLLFFPNSENRTHNTYTVYAPLANDVLIYKDGTIQNLGIPTDTTVYSNGQQTLLKNILPTLDIGYIISVATKEDGSTDYITVESNSLEGPFIANSSIINSYSETTTVIRDGKKSSTDLLQLNDVLYYSKSLNTVWAYSKKVTGVYESATPNKDTPISITVSGKSYTLEGAAAYNALSSAGSFDFGDTITLLLGRNGDVAGVINADSRKDETPIVGYVTATGQKLFTNANGNEYSSLYVTVVQTDGKAYEYTTNSNYKSLVNTIVEVSFSNGKAILKDVPDEKNVSGTVNYKNMTLGSYKLADDVEILDVSTTAEGNTPLYCSVFVQRLDGISISAMRILYCGKNSAGEIEKLILNDVTGDIYSYGVVTKGETSGNNTFGTYTYMIGGNASTISSSTVYSVSTGQPAKFVLNGAKLESISPITVLNEKITGITPTTITAGGKTYPLSDKVAVYEKKLASTYTYLDTPLNDLIENKDDYTIRAYIDKSVSAGGRVRILMIEKK